MPNNDIVVVALGGNAILRRGEKGTFEEQYRNVCETVQRIADLVQNGYKVVITHGNGPQVGATLLRHEAAKSIVPPFPLDVCGSETQGFIGYMIQQALRNELKKRGMDKYVITVVTRVIIDADDEAFRNPTKPVGPFYTEEEADKIRSQHPDFVVKEDAGRGYRRVVASPDPKIIAERLAIRALVDNGFVVVACGGGGIPIVEEGTQARGIEAVIDKDLAGQRLATLIDASVFVILTDIDGAYLNYGTAKQSLIKEATLQQLEQYMKEGHFKEGSMSPKISAAMRFVESGGKEAIIAELSKLAEAMQGKSGTHVVRVRA
ncbi:carbamate kinase [Candidatus Bathyarchaeota archaeon]|nr:carbamate kinase [Candidatus Bathyarchaeota archaeon]